MNLFTSKAYLLAGLAPESFLYPHGWEVEGDNEDCDEKCYDRDDPVFEELFEPEGHLFHFLEVVGGVEPIFLENVADGMNLPMVSLHTDGLTLQLSPLLHVRNL